MKLSVGETPLASPKRPSHFTAPAQHSKPHRWLSGNDASYWESSLFPGANFLSKMAFILHWLDAIFLACLIWHDQNLKQSVREQRRAGAVAGAVPQRLLQKKMPPPLDWRVFPLLLLLSGCEMTCTHGFGICGFAYFYASWRKYSSLYQ